MPQQDFYEWWVKEQAGAYEQASNEKMIASYYREVEAERIRGALNGGNITDYLAGRTSASSEPIASNGPEPVKILKRGTLLGWGLELFEGIFSSAHVPNWASLPLKATGVFDKEGVKSVAWTAKFQKRENITGSYTITFSNGRKYHGKGSITRMTISAIEKMAKFNIKVTMFDWTPANSNKEAFKQEYRRMQTDATFNAETQRFYQEGFQNPINYNLIQSPGKNYIDQDGF